MQGLAKIRLVKRVRETVLDDAEPTPWSRGLWGTFLPERRRRDVPVRAERRGSASNDAPQ